MPRRTKTKAAEARALGGSVEARGTARGRVGSIDGGLRRLSRKEAAGGSPVSSSSPGRASGTPYRSSAADRL